MRGGGEARRHVSGRVSPRDDSRGEGGKSGGRAAAKEEGKVLPMVKRGSSASLASSASSKTVVVIAPLREVSFGRVTVGDEPGLYRYCVLLCLCR